MSDWIKDAREHENRAEKALEVSWMSLKFSKDTLAASLEYNSAATAYQNGKQIDDAIRCFEQTWILKKQLGDHQGAGRAYEQAAKMQEQRGNIDQAMELWEQGIRCFRLADKPDLAVKLLLRGAEVCSKDEQRQGEVGTRYEEVLQIFEDTSQLHLMSEVFRDYQSFLLRTNNLTKLLSTLDRHIATLVTQKQLPFAYREVLNKVVICLCSLQDSVQADEAISKAVENVTGWLGSEEYGDAQEFLDAVQNRDDETLQKLKKKSAFSFIQIDMARLFKQYELGGNVDDLM